MDGYTRYALYAAPRDGPLTRLGARWLGWDAEAGRGAPSARDEEWPTLPRPRRALTSPARNYGFHATLKAPFALAEGATVVELHAALSALAPRLGRVRVDGLRVGALGPVVALLPEGDTSAVDALSAKLVEALDGFRAPPSPEELARRRAPGLTARQEEMLRRWGYPHTMAEYRFHITLTGPMADPSERDAVIGALGALFDPLVDRPFRIDDICLFGEGQDRRFRNLHRYPLPA